MIGYLLLAALINAIITIIFRDQLSNDRINFLNIPPLRLCAGKGARCTEQYAFFYIFSLHQISHVL